jgi:hypothetical protein
VVEKAAALSSLREAFSPLFERWGHDLLKVSLFYLEQNGQEALLDTLVVESGHRQHFFIQLLPREGRLTVRLLPHTDPEKTDAVKRALAAVALFVKNASAAECRFGATNIGDFLEGEGRPG